MHPSTQEEKKHLEVTVAVIWCSATNFMWSDVSWLR